MPSSTTIPGGIIPPIPTFFDGAGALDLDTQRRHVTWLATFALGGVLALGSNGEAMHLDDAERVAVIAATRSAIDDAGRSDLALLAGAADLSTRGTIARCRAAAEAGANAAVVLPPFAFPTQMTPTALVAHFRAVADASPIPLILYNMPANTAGINLSAETILALAAHPNVIGMKDSSGQVEKLAHVAAGARPGFAVLAGSGGFLLPALAVGATGAIAALANAIPDRVAALHHGWRDRFDAPSIAGVRAREDELRELQARVIPLNALVTARYGVAGLKAALDLARGYGGAPRAPLTPLDATGRAEIAAAWEALRD